jgi:hypothetical protein
MEITLLKKVKEICVPSKQLSLCTNHTQIAGSKHFQGLRTIVLAKLFRTIKKLMFRNKEEQYIECRTYWRRHVTKRITTMCIN